jgi:hypothetical protein
MTDFQPGEVVVAVVPGNCKPRPAVVFARRSDGYLLAPLTSTCAWSGIPHRAFDPDHVLVYPGRFLTEGNVWGGRMVITPEENIDPDGTIGRCLLPMAELILDVHGHEDLTIGEIEQFLWACDKETSDAEDQVQDR